jgi:hypothetical protein
MHLSRGRAIKRPKAATPPTATHSGPQGGSALTNISHVSNIDASDGVVLYRDHHLPSTGVPSKEPRKDTESAVPEWQLANAQRRVVMFTAMPCMHCSKHSRKTH